MFQLAYLTAQTLGVADQTHDAMFNAVWQGSDLAVIDTATGRIKGRLPTIEDAAKFYKAQAGVPIDKFLATAKSFSVDVKVRAAEALSPRTARSHTDHHRERQVPAAHRIGRWRRRIASSSSNG